jgi:hypothetical protein
VTSSPRKPAAVTRIDGLAYDEAHASGELLRERSTNVTTSSGSAAIGASGPQTLTTRSNSSVMRANSGGVIQLAFIQVRSSSVAPRATAQPFQT